MELEKIRELIKQGERRSAQRELARLLKSDPGSVEAWLLLGQQVEDPARKSECYRRVLDFDPGNPQASQALEWLYFQPGLEMELPEKKGIPQPVEPLEPDVKPEAFPEQTLFDLDSLEPAFPSPANRTDRGSARAGHSVSPGKTPDTA
jgi:hypothetical protein